jgi:ketosteroid isomerase-like protein
MFTAQAKATGKSFSSDWALYTVIKNGKIFEYFFYEDSENLVKQAGSKTYY